MEDLFEVLLSSVTDSSSSPSSSSSYSVEGGCSICWEPLNQSNHHACALKCGHTFGLPCIEKWAQEKLPSLCPLCNTRFAVSQVSKLFVRQDNEQLDRNLSNLVARISELDRMSPIERIRDFESTVRDIRYKLRTQKEWLKAQKPTTTSYDDIISRMQSTLEARAAHNAALLVRAVQILKEEQEEREAAADVSQSVVVEEEPVEGVVGSETSSIRHGGTSNRGGDDGYERDNNDGGSNVNGTATINTA